MSNDHPYLKIFQISKRYAIEMQFHNEAKTKVDINAGKEGDTKVTPGLYDKQILLVPVYKSGDSLITGWECLTNADSYFSVTIQGGIPAVDGDRSFITRYTTNPYLALCTYVNGPLFQYNSFPW